VQVMPEADAAGYRFNPFDLTKVWPQADYPLIEIGTLTLNRNPDNYFAEVEQAAFSPGHFVPGIGPSPDKMLQGRLFAYGDAHRYRLGINHTRLPVNAPRAVPGGAANYGRDGAMRFDVDPRHAKNYEPNSFDGPAQSGKPLYNGLATSGVSGTTATERHAEDDDFTQAGALYRLMTEDERDRLVARIGASLGQVSRQDIVDRAIAHFRNADAEYGARVEAAVKG
jgi:catalase